MRRLCLFILAFLVVIPVFSQIKKGRIYLKNGSIIKGKFQIRDEKIQIQSAGNLWVFSPEEIDIITRIREHNAKAPEGFLPVPSFFYRIEAGMLIGNSQNNQSAPFTFQGSANYRLGNHFAAGLGLGAEFFSETYMPAFLNFEFRLKNVETSPYIFFKGGYEVALEDGNTVYYGIRPIWSSVYYPWYNSMENLKAQGGFMVNPGIGLSRTIAPGLGVSLAFGYQFHRLNYSAGEDYGLEVDYNRLTIKVGILFN